MKIAGRPVLGAGSERDLGSATDKIKIAPLFKQDVAAKKRGQDRLAPEATKKASEINLPWQLRRQMEGFKIWQKYRFPQQEPLSASKGGTCWVRRQRTLLQIQALNAMS